MSSFSSPDFRPAQILAQKSGLGKASFLGSAILAQVLGQNWTKMGPKWTHFGPKWANFGPKWLKMGHFGRGVAQF